MIPFLTLTISTLVAWIISIISSRLRNKTFVSVFFTVLFLIVYFVACGAFGGIVGAGTEGDIDLSGLKNTYIFYWMGSAMSGANAINLLLAIACTVIPATITFILLNCSFIKIITTVRGARKIEYKEKSEKTSSPLMAVYKKELRRFFTSYAYILNAGIGNIMTLIIAVMIAIVGPELLIELEGVPMIAGTASSLVTTIASMVIVLCASMNFVSAPSVSLEDKNLWILQSAPISAQKVLMAKLLTHMTICAPLTVISAVIVAVGLKFTVLDAVAIILSSMAIVAFTAYFGLALGVKFPKFDWQNETVAVKQGFAVFGAMFGTMIWAMIFFGVGIVLGIMGIGFWATGFIFTFLNAIVCMLLHLYLMNGGAKRFADLKK